jgi:hypothetical protein
LFDQDLGVLLAGVGGDAHEVHGVAECVGHLLELRHLRDAGGTCASKEVDDERCARVAGEVVGAAVERGEVEVDV